jgi:hypothetical protein
MEGCKINAIFLCIGFLYVCICVLFFGIFLYVPFARMSMLRVTHSRDIHLKPVYLLHVSRALNKLRTDTNHVIYLDFMHQL